MKIGDKVERIHTNNIDANGVKFVIGEVGIITNIKMDEDGCVYADVLKENGEAIHNNLLDYLEVIEEASAEPPKIKDSGNRTMFSTGAVRDLQDSKGRCDLLPLDIIYDSMNYITDPIKDVLMYIHEFKQSGETIHLFGALDLFRRIVWDKRETMYLELSEHYRDGCEKYGENNWQKGIPAKNYINSALRHLFKYMRGDKDEPHDRAFAWNILCCIWTCVHKPELNSYAKS